MDINSAAHAWNGLVETVAAELTEAAYPVLLRHGRVDSWVDLELELWSALSATLHRVGADLFRPPAGASTRSDGRRAPVAQPQALRERLVTYYGLDEDGAPTSQRFLSYKIIASPGPSEGSGLATIVTLALSNLREGCDNCQKFHTVEQGGAAAAMAAAINYLDAYHADNRLHKVESEVRG